MNDSIIKFLVPYVIALFENGIDTCHSADIIPLSQIKNWTQSPVLDISYIHKLRDNGICYDHISGWFRKINNA